MNLEQMHALARFRVQTVIDNRTLEAKVAIREAFAEARKRLLPDGVDLPDGAKR